MGQLRQVAMTLVRYEKSHCVTDHAGLLSIASNDKAGALSNKSGILSYSTTSVQLQIQVTVVLLPALMSQVVAMLGVKAETNDCFKLQEMNGEVRSGRLMMVTKISHNQILRHRHCLVQPLLIQVNTSVTQTHKC